MGAHLLEHPNPHGEHFYRTRRRCQHGHDRPHLIVIHTSEQLPDHAPPDDSAAGLSAYVSTTSRRVSWHRHVDADDRVIVLPDTYTAWHASGFNRCALGLEQCTQARRWGDAPERWVRGILANAAAEVAEWSARWSIPLVVLGRRQVDAGMAGLVAHATLDPTRRSDPGAGYPWDLLIALTHHLPYAQEDDEMMTPEQMAELKNHIDTRFGELEQRDATREREWAIKVAAAVAGISVAEARDRIRRFD